jgi:hypothetical protein
MCEDEQSNVANIDNNDIILYILASYYIHVARVPSSCHKSQVASQLAHLIPLTPSFNGHFGLPVACYPLLVITHRRSPLVFIACSSPFPYLLLISIIKVFRQFFECIAPLCVL